MNNKLLIISGFSDSYSEIGGLSSQSIEIYARKFGHDFEIFKFRPDGQQGWDKIDLLIEILKRKSHEFLFWVDADAIFANFRKDILRDVAQQNNETHFWIANHLCTLKPLSGSKRPYGIFRFGRFGQILGSYLMGRHKGIYLQIERPNAGILLMRNSDWTLNFLELVRAQRQGNRYPFAEQGAIHNLIGLYFENSKGRKRNKINLEILNSIEWLDDEWNNVPLLMNISRGQKFYTSQSNNPIIFHLAGMNDEFRKKFMEKTLEDLRNLESQ